MELKTPVVEPVELELEEEVENVVELKCNKNRFLALVDFGDTEDWCYNWCMEPAKLKQPELKEVETTPEPQGKQERTFRLQDKT